MRLSDLYTHKEENPSLELIVTQININPGYNDELLEKCPTLKAYVQYVDKVRTYQKDMPLDAAVELAIQECIDEGILVDFLKKNKTEVTGMSLFEYNKELHERTLIEEGREEGERIGREVGLREGQKLGRESGLKEGQKLGQNLLAEAVMLCRSKNYTSVSELTQSGFDEETAKLALSIC